MGDWLERNRMYVISALFVVVATGGVAFWIRLPRPEPIIISTPAPTATPTPASTSTPSSLRVYVSGAVRAPDVYVLPPGSIVKDAIHAAGGASAHAELNRINLALQLYDQQQIYVPSQGEDTLPVALPTAGASPTPDSLSASSPSKVNINAASAQELETLPGIGPAIAGRILDYRTEHGPFATVEDIMNVKGIGPATFAKLEGLIAVR